MDQNNQYAALSQEIGLRILCRRKQLRLTQEQLAEKAGVSHQFFSCVELGKKNMRAENIVRLSRAMEVSTDYILTGKSNEVDYSYFTSMLRKLDENQLRCVEEVIKNILAACGYDPIPFE